MRDSAQYKNIRRLTQLTLISGMLVASSAWGFETNYDRGRVDFAGRVTDISCSVALNGGNNAGSGSVWLAPVSLAEVHARGAGAFMKPQSFTLELSNCQLRHDGGAANNDEISTVSVRWIDGFTVNTVGNENAGYLANTPAAKPGAFGGKSGKRRCVYLLHRLRYASAGESDQWPVDQLGNLGVSV